MIQSGHRRSTDDEFPLPNSRFRLKPDNTEFRTPEMIKALAIKGSLPELAREQGNITTRAQFEFVTHIPPSPINDGQWQLGREARSLRANHVTKHNPTLDHFL
jgi:hypothetical protein